MTLPTRSDWSLVMAVVLVAIALAPVTASAQDDCGGVPHCGPYVDDPGDPCLGPEDPFCAGGGGGGITYEHTGGCFYCQYIPQSPDGDPSYYYCDDLGPVEGNGNPSKCTDEWYGCDMSGQCLLV